MPRVSSQSFSCSPLSKPFGNHLFGSLPLHSSHTAFPFPPNPIYLSSLNLFTPQQWFASHNSLNTPLSLTTNDSKDISNNSNDNNNNNKDNKYKDSTQPLIGQNNNLSEKIESTTTTSVSTDNSISCNNSSPNISMNDSERNTTRSHSGMN
jgi:hypothetical protein